MSPEKRTDETLTPGMIETEDESVEVYDWEHEGVLTDLDSRYFGD